MVNCEVFPSPSSLSPPLPFSLAENQKRGYAWAKTNLSYTI